MLRYIRVVTREDSIRNKYIRGNFGVASKVDKVSTNRLGPIGHVMKTEETRAVRVAMKMNNDGKKRRRKTKKLIN